MISLCLLFWIWFRLRRHQVGRLQEVAAAARNPVVQRAAQVGHLPTPDRRQQRLITIQLKTN